MNDTRELLRRGVEGFEPAPDAFERVLVRRDRKRRNRRFAAGIVGIAVFLIAAAGFVRLLGSERTTPADPEPAPRRNGTWVVISAQHLDPDPDAPLSGRGPKSNLYVAGPDGTTRLLVGSEGDKTTRVCPRFSPDGSLLAYGEERNASTRSEMAIVVTGFTSSGQLHGRENSFTVPASTPLVHPCPVWAPDGHRLAVIAPGLGLLFVDVDATRSLVPIDDPGVAGLVPAVEWSPDGSRVALLVATRFDETVWIVPADGSSPRRLIEFGRDALANTVTWAPDSRSVVVGGSYGSYFSGCCKEARPFIKVVDVASGDASDVPLSEAWNGSTVMQVLSTGDDRFLVERLGTGRLAPDWLDFQGNVTPIDLEYPLESPISLSPDGTQILYVTYDVTHDPPANVLLAVPLDGGEPTRYSPWTNGLFDNFATFTWQPR